MIKHHDILDLLDLARRNGIAVYQKDAKLKFKVAKNQQIKHDVLDLLRQHKVAILDFLTSAAGHPQTIQKVEESIEAIDRSAVGQIPLSFSQERLWFIDQFDGSTQYHLPTILRLKNKLDRQHLAGALSDLVERHEILRTVIIGEEGQAYQEVMPATHWQLEYSEGKLFKDSDYLNLFIQDTIARPFDLSKDYTLRAHLIRCGVEDHVLIIVLHHIASDGWSNAILVKDLMAFYQASIQKRSPQLPPLPIQYADYAYWQRKQFSDQALEQALDWWQNRLANIDPLELPTDYPRPAIQSTRGAGFAIQLDEELTQKLKQLSLANNTTLYMTMMAAFKVLLSRYSG
ncbi:MAG: condensation domain-containing protein, partial [Bacteroidota bacterium]